MSFPLGIWSEKYLAELEHQVPSGSFRILSEIDSIGGSFEAQLEFDVGWRYACRIVTLAVVDYSEI